MGVCRVTDGTTVDGGRLTAYGGRLTLGLRGNL